MIKGSFPFPDPPPHSTRKFLMSILRGTAVPCMWSSSGHRLGLGESVRHLFRLPPRIFVQNFRFLGICVRISVDVSVFIGNVLYSGPVPGFCLGTYKLYFWTEICMEGGLGGYKWNGDSSCLVIIIVAIISFLQ